MIVLYKGGWGYIKAKLETMKVIHDDGIYRKHPSTENVKPNTSLKWALFVKDKMLAKIVKQDR